MISRSRFRPLLNRSPGPLYRNPLSFLSSPGNRSLLPDGWPRPKGYSNGILAEGKSIFVGGQIGWDAREQLVGENLVSQVEQALKNIVAVLAAGGAKPEHIVRMTWYVVDLEDYRSARAEIGRTYVGVIGKHFPAMSLVKVAGLLEPGAKVEIEVTAVIPPKPPETIV